MAGRARPGTSTRNSALPSSRPPLDVAGMKNLWDIILAEGQVSTRAGEDKVKDALTAYRDGIKFVYDKTMEGINRGKTPDELVQEVTLPARLAQHPYLQEYYGTVAWSVRGIYSQNAGWFDGNPTHIFPLTEKERAEKSLRWPVAQNKN
ncbi:hypothetical protein GCM10027287_16400 [Bordetella muralis]